MNEEQLNALQALANSVYWDVVSKQILTPYFKDVSEPSDEWARALIAKNPAAAYIGRLFAHKMLMKAIDDIDRFKTGPIGKQEDYK